MNTNEKTNDIMFYIFIGLMAVGFFGVLAFVVYSILN
jgi:hypothetical protein